MIEVPRIQAVQPQWLARIGPRAPAGLLYLCNHADLVESIRNAIDGSIIAYSTFNGEKQGIGYRGAGPKPTGSTLATVTETLSSAFTLFAVVSDWNTGATAQSIMDDDDGASRAWQFRVYNNKVDLIRFNSTGSAFTASSATLTTAQNKAGICIVARSNGTAVDVWVDGVKTSATLTGTPKTPNSTFSVLGRKGNLQPFLGRCYLTGAASGALDDATCADLSRNLWQLFLAPAGRAYFDVSAGGGNTVAVPVGQLTLTGYAPTVTATANQKIAVPAGALTLTGYAPSVSVSASQTIQVPAGQLTLTGNAPTVSVSDHKTVSVPVGQLTLTGYAPTVVSGVTVEVPTGQIALTGHAPAVVVTENQTIQVPSGSIAITGYAPTVLGYEPVVVARAGGGLSSRRRKPRLLIVEVDGAEYKLPETEVDSFLESVEKEEKPAIEPIRKLKKKASSPAVQIKSAPPDIRPIVQQQIDQTNEKLRQAWERALVQREIEEEEETLIWLIAA